MKARLADAVARMVQNVGLGPAIIGAFDKVKACTDDPVRAFRQ